MSFKKFEDQRREAQKELEERLAKIAFEEAQEREKRIKPLSERFVTIFQEVVTKALNDRVDDLDRPKFRRALVRARLELCVKAEIDALLAVEETDLGDEAEKNVETKSQNTAASKADASRKTRPAVASTEAQTNPDAAQ